MHGNTPYAGQPSEPTEISTEQITALRDDISSVTEQTRSLLPDEFVVGSELQEEADGALGRIAVQPPVGQVITSSVPVDASEKEHSELAHELAAGAALQVKRAIDEIHPTAG